MAAPVYAGQRLPKRFRLVDQSQPGHIHWQQKKHISRGALCYPGYYAVLGFDIETCYAVNPLRPRQNGRHFADDTIFLNENVTISIKISPKFAPKGSINNIPALVQIMAWRRPGDQPLSESMMVSLLTHICVTRPQWVNTRSRRSSI